MAAEPFVVSVGLREPDEVPPQESPDPVLIL